MADSHKNECSAPHGSGKVPGSPPDSDTTTKSRVNSEKVGSSVCNKLQLSWTGDFSSLKRFVCDDLKLNGDWSQPGGDKKVFNVGSSSISWRKNKKVLQFHGKEVSKFKRMFCLEICDDITNNLNVIDSEILAVNNNVNSSCSCRCNELLTDIEGLKLDQVIAERATQSIGDVLTKLQKDHNDMRQQIDKLKEETRESLQNHAKKLPYFEYSNTDRQVNPSGNNLIQKFPKANGVNNAGNNRSNPIICDAPPNTIDGEVNNRNEPSLISPHTRLPANNEAEISAQLQDYRSKQKRAFKSMNSPPSVRPTKVITPVQNGTKKQKKDKEIRRKPSVLVIGDSSLTKIKISKLCKATGEKVSCRIIPTAKIENIAPFMANRIVPANIPNSVIIHMGPKFIRSETTQSCSHKIQTMLSDVQQLLPKGKISISGCIVTKDQFAARLPFFNQEIRNICRRRNQGKYLSDFIDNSNIPPECWQGDTLSLNDYGSLLLENNIKYLIHTN